MAAMSSAVGMLPEQVWDWDPIPEHHLQPGKPSGSAMPLVWAHSEFIKLCYSRARAFPVDRPAATWARYAGKRPKLSHTLWGPCYRPRQVILGDRFSVVLRDPARVHWGCNGWQAIQDSFTSDVGLGVHQVKLSLAGLAVGDTLQFTIYWIDQACWEGQNYEVLLIDEHGSAAT
jgi:glucoamylase